MSIDWAVTAQMITALAALGALIWAPFYAGKRTHRQLVSQSKQQWLNELRQDIAHLIAVHTNDIFLISNKKKDMSNVDIERTAVLLSKIRMLLDSKNSEHNELLNQVEKFVASWDPKKEQINIARVTDAFEPVRKKAWQEIKLGKF